MYGSGMGGYGGLGGMNSYGGMGGMGYGGMGGMGYGGMGYGGMGMGMGMGYGMGPNGQLTWLQTLTQNVGNIVQITQLMGGCFGALNQAFGTLIQLSTNIGVMFGICEPPQLRGPNGQPIPPPVEPISPKARRLLLLGIFSIFIAFMGYQIIRNKRRRGLEEAFKSSNFPAATRWPQRRF